MQKEMDLSIDIKVKTKTKMLPRFGDKLFDRNMHHKLFPKNFHFVEKEI